MGFKQIEVVPSQISVLQPAAKAHQIKAFQATRTDTANPLKVVLPAQSSVTDITVYGSTASNAGTTATLTVTISDNSGVISTGTYDVKTNGATTGSVNMTALPNIEPLPLNGDLKINVDYAETGTASTTGGPWNIAVEYVA